MPGNDLEGIVAAMRALGIQSIGLFAGAAPSIAVESPAADAASTVPPPSVFCACGHEDIEHGPHGCYYCDPTKCGQAPAAEAAP